VSEEERDGQREEGKEADAGPAMEWDLTAERLLGSLADMVPDTMRPLARASARDESQLVASERGAGAVAAEDVIRGWIRITPPDQRNSLVEVIDGLGYEPEDFADELESGEGWGEEEA